MNNDLLQQSFVHNLFQQLLSETLGCVSHTHGSLCSVYLASTWHGSGGNVTSDIERMGLNIDYNSSFLRQEESQYLANPPEIARHFPTHIQKLCGYACPTLQSER